MSTFLPLSPSYKGLLPQKPIKKTMLCYRPLILWVETSKIWAKTAKTLEKMIKKSQKNHPKKRFFDPRRRTFPLSAASPRDVL